MILYGRALGLSHSEAEDVMQETFISILKKEVRPEDPEHYCIRAFRNRALNFKRGLWRRVKRELESARWFEKGGDGTDVEEKAVLALQNLPAEQREVIVLRIWHSYTLDEIGNLLGISPNTIAGRYRYGMQKLKISLNGAENESIQRIETTAQVFDSKVAF